MVIDLFGNAELTMTKEGELALLRWLMDAAGTGKWTWTK